MSSAEEPDDDDIELVSEPPHPDSIQWLFFDPGVRNYVFAGFGALAMIFVILFSLGGLPGAVMIVLLGVAGLLLRWSAVPPFVLIILFWFMVFPYGLPPGYEDSYEIINGRFRVADVILVFSVVVYVSCHYRLLGLSKQAMPFDGPTKRKGEKPYRRPPTLILAGEIGRLLAMVGAVVIAGQLAWIIVTSLEADPGSFIPLKPLEDSRNVYRRNGGSGEMSLGLNRFIVLTGMLFFTVVFARLIFGYWRLRELSPVEAGMILQEAGWDENRREHMRLEKWRARAKKQAEERAHERNATKAKGGGSGRREAEQ